MNGGVLVFETGRFYGGDSGYYYVGTAEIRHGEIIGEGRVVKHNPLAVSAFGDDAQQFDVRVRVNLTEGEQVVGSLERLDKPETVLPIRLTLKERLP